MVQPLGNCTRILGNTDMGNSMRGMAWPRSQLEMPVKQRLLAWLALREAWALVLSLGEVGVRGRVLGGSWVG